MSSASRLTIRQAFRGIGTKNVIVLLLVFLLTVAVTCVGAYLLYNSTKESIELKAEANTEEAAKEFDEYLLVRKSSVILAGHVVDEMVKEKRPNSEILEYLTAQSLSIKKSIDMDYTGLYGWINGEYLDGVGWVPDADYIPTERPWYQEAIAEGGRTTFVKPYLDEQTGTVLTTIAEQLSSGADVLALDISLGRIEEITADIAQHTPGGIGLILDKDGQVIAHSDKSELGKNYLEETGTLGAALASTLYSGNNGQFELNYGGQTYLAYTERIEGDWTAVFLINTEEFYRPLMIIFPILAILTLLELIVFIMVIYNQSQKNLAIASAKEAESANRAKTQFLSQMSHEIRTPINAIIGLDSIVLRDEGISPQTRDALEKIGSSARHLLSLINDILDMSRIESGRMVLNEEVFSFRELLDQVAIIVGGQCEDKGLEFICNKTELVDEYYVGDNLKLKQVIINILGNSVKFTETPGIVTLTVEQLTESEGHCTMKFTMKDTGIGMDEEFIPKLFETFSQEDTANTSRYGGSGLGMAITKNFVELMGGDISVESEKGHGTTFFVTVKLKRAQEVELPEASPSEESVPVATTTLEGRHMLIAEDQKMNAEVLTDLLELEGMTCEWAENGKLAVELFDRNEEGHFDAILMDMRMPVMDGLAATQEIRKLSRPDAATIPIIALTANAFEEDVKQCLQAGMNAHLSKPVDIDLLISTLEKLL